MYYGHMSYFGGIGMVIIWAVFIGIIIWLIVQNSNKTERKMKPEKILKKRLANGEISEKEYDRLKKKLFD